MQCINIAHHASRAQKSCEIIALTNQNNIELLHQVVNALGAFLQDFIHFQISWIWMLIL